MTRAKWSVGILCSAVLLGCESATAPAPLDAGPPALASAADAGIVASVAGSGIIRREDGSMRNFTVSARKYADGSVRGQYNLVNGPFGFMVDDGFTPPLARLHGEITCMSIVDGHVYLGGTVSLGVNNELFVGPGPFTGVAIEVIDHPDAADQVSPVGLYTPESPTTPQDYCDAPVPGPMFTVEQGSITVRS